MKSLLRKLRGADPKPKSNRKKVNLATAGRRRAWRVHLGRARSSARGRAHRHRGHFRHIGGRDECHHARRRDRARRRGRSTPAARRVLARREPRRQPPRHPAQRGRPPVLVHALRGLAGAGLVQRGRALHVAVRPQPAQHQSAARPDRALRRLRSGARLPGHQPVHLGHQRAHRPPARLPEGEDLRRCHHGVGLPAVSVSRGRDRRRALLGRRLHGQSGDLPVLRRDRGRGRADRADQSGRARRDADDADRDHEPHQRDHLQLLAAGRIPRDRFRHPHDRPEAPAARHRQGRVPPHQRASHRARLDVQEADRAQQAQFGLRFLPDAAQGRPPRGAEFSERALRRHRREEHGGSAAEAKAEWA